MQGAITIFKAIWRSLTFIGAVVGILYLWPDIQGLPQIYPDAFGRITMPERETIMAAALVIAAIYIFWIDVRRWAVPWAVKHKRIIAAKLGTTTKASKIKVSTEYRDIGFRRKPEADSADPRKIVETDYIGSIKYQTDLINQYTRNVENCSIVLTRISSGGSEVLPRPLTLDYDNFDSSFSLRPGEHIRLPIISCELGNLAERGKMPDKPCFSIDYLNNNEPAKWTFPLDDKCRLEFQIVADNIDPVYLAFDLFVNESNHYELFPDNANHKEVHRRSPVLNELSRHQFRLLSSLMRYELQKLHSPLTMCRFFQKLYLDQSRTEYG